MITGCCCPNSRSCPCWGGSCGEWYSEVACESATEVGEEVSLTLNFKNDTSSADQPYVGDYHWDFEQYPANGVVELIEEVAVNDTQPPVRATYRVIGAGKARFWPYTIGDVLLPTGASGECTIYVPEVGDSGDSADTADSGDSADSADTGGQGDWGRR